MPRLRELKNKDFNNTTKRYENNNFEILARVEEELSHSLVLAGVIVSKLHLDGLLAGCAIQHKGFLAVFALNHLAPDGRRGETPVLVGLEGEVELVAGITCMSR